MPETLTVFSPLAGQAVSLEQVPDPVFSEKMLGDGIAIEPFEGILYAPFDGKIINFNKALHALVIAKDNFELLIHVGLETVHLQGEGFKAFAKEGEEIKQGQKLLEFDLSFLKNKVPSTLVMLVLTAPADVPVFDKFSGEIKVGDLLCKAGDSSHEATAVSSCASSEQYIDFPPVTVLNPNGLHARPAGVFAKLAGKHPEKVQILFGEKTANAKSVVEIMGLALSKGDNIVLRAYGETAAAQNLLQELAQAIQDGLGEEVHPSANAATNTAVTELDFSSPTPLNGLCACGGMTQGKTYRLEEEETSFPKDAANPSQETAFFQQSVDALQHDLENRLAKENNLSSRAILQAHLELLRDPLLHDTTHTHLSAGRSAAFAFNEAIRHGIDVLKNTNQSFLMERIADLKDLRRLLLKKLLGKEDTQKALPDGCIITAEEVYPSDIPLIAASASGVLLANGSPTAHASIMLRNLGIPTLVGIGQAVCQIPNGICALIDADKNSVLLNPTPEQEASFSQRHEKAQRQKEEDRKSAALPAVTQDGKKIFVEGNISTVEEARSAAANGAEGLGLIRTELLFYGRNTAPSEEEQTLAYQQIADAAQPHTVTFRTLDAGGDKPLPFVNIPKEENPIVGIRGIRAFKDNADLFTAQLRALLRVKTQGKLRIMLPMISFVEEFLFFKNLIRQEEAKLGRTVPAEIGMMIEVPSAALLAEDFAKEADFFSIGTNDLTQYALAIDRGHKILSAKTDALHPAVLKLISLTCQGAAKYNRPVGVCGAAAGDLQAAAIFIGLGVTELAVGANSAPSVKALVRRISAEKCRQTAQKALTLSDAQLVRNLVAQEFENK